jgi:hypothetical protein
MVPTSFRSRRFATWYAHGQRKGLIPADLKHNPVRPPELGVSNCLFLIQKLCPVEWK